MFLFEEPSKCTGHMKSTLVPEYHQQDWHTFTSKKMLSMYLCIINALTMSKEKLRNSLIANLFPQNNFKKMYSGRLGTL